MDDAKALAQHQQQLMMQHHQQQQQHHHQQQQLYLLQQFQQQQRQQQQQQQQQAAAVARFPSNIDAHLRPLGSNRPSNLSQNPNPNSTPNSSYANQQQQQQQQLQAKMNRPPPSQSQSQAQPQQQQQPLAGNQAELQMAYQDAWRVCHPDFKRPFSSLEDACERLLPYHVVADYEAEEDDRILESDSTGEILSRSQHWDQNIAAKVADFTATFEKQALAFNIITKKRAMGGFRSEERLMLEQFLIQDEKRAIMELRAEMESREKAGREAHEAKLRLAAIQARAESQAQAELMARAPIRASALGSQTNDVSLSHVMAELEQGVNPDEMINGWGNNAQRAEREPSDDFLNDEEAENGDAGMQEDLRESPEFDLNTR